MEVRQTIGFESWLAALRDREARRRIFRRIDKLTTRGLFGQTKSVGGGISELKLDYGPGYRLYFTRRGLSVIFLLVGGDKGSQARDILEAQRQAALLD